MGTAGRNQGLLLGVLLVAGFADLGWLNLSLAPQLEAELASEQSAPVGTRVMAESARSAAPVSATAEDRAAEPTVDSETPEPSAEEPTAAERARAAGAERKIPRSEAQEEQGEAPAERGAGQESSAVAGRSAEPPLAERTAEAAEKAPPERAAPKLGPLPTLDNLYFATGRFQLRASGRQTLRRVAAELDKRPALRVHLRGHADRRGAEEHNRSLAGSRAESAQRYLQGLGVDAGRISTESVGSTEPLDAGDTPDAWAKNRRVEIAWRGQR
jgi:outer membrane protein OmpA-like peptidoglycan-associated protein